MYEHVDPFIGTEATALPARTGLAATWWWPKPQVGNTHPGACAPLGMVSACAYSGAYPTGYGRYDLSTAGRPATIHDELAASGFTHFQQSGTGAIRKYYNYFRVTPMLDPLDALGTVWPLRDEVARPGYYAATLETRSGDPGGDIRAELTVGAKSAVHRYTFPEHSNARLVVDFAQGGLGIPFGATIPLRAHLELISPGVASGEIVVEGAPLAVHIECDAGDWRQMLWYDRRLMPGGTRLAFDRIRPTTLRPFGLMWAGAAEAGRTVEIRLGFSLRGVEQAHSNLVRDLGEGTSRFDRRRATTRAAWIEALDAIEIESESPHRRTVFATALYHSLVKPCLAPDESPFWPTDGSFAFDFSTMWDIYRTQLPLIALIAPRQAVEIACALLNICEEEGNFPIGYRMARGSDRFSRQASALAHTFLADLCQAGVSGIDWDWALVHMQNDIRRAYGEDYLVRGVAHPISHTLDLAFGYWCTARVAERVGDRALAEDCELLATQWVHAFDPATGVLRNSDFYEGTKLNYSFRILHDMRRRIELAGGDAAFVALLDAFFGFGAAPAEQPGVRPDASELQAGYALGRFEGLNNEPDMDAPWAYLYAGRPDRTAEIVHAAREQAFGTGRGGLAGNDDSGGLSSWYIWASLGVFPVAGQDLFLLHPPAVHRSRIRLESGMLEIVADGFREPSPDSPARYIAAATFRGEPLERAWLTGTELRAGGTLRFALADSSGTWGRSPRPPSYAAHRPVAPATEPIPVVVSAPDSFTSYDVSPNPVTGLPAAGSRRA